MIDWQLIPDEIDLTKQPFDGQHVLIYADSATVDIVRLAFWNPGGILDYSTGNIIDPEPEDEGWWSYIHSVTSEQIHHAPGCKWSHWAPFNPPTGSE